MNIGRRVLPAVVAALLSLSAKAGDAHEAFDRQTASAEALGILQELIRIPTVNPPGGESALLRRVSDILEKEGIRSELQEPAPGRGVLRAAIEGEGTQPALLALAHVDVVGVEEGKWSVDPFAAVVKDGYLYGRGAIDDKGMAAALLETMILLKRSATPHSRGLVLILEGDEESGGRLGIAWVLKNRPDWVANVAFALNEGGRVLAARPPAGSAPGGEVVQWVGVQNVEKLSFSVEVTARGTSGHASMPREDNALFRLGRALAALSEHRPLPRLIPETRTFFQALAAAAAGTEAEDYGAVVDLVKERVRAGGSFLAPKYEWRLIEGPHTQAVCRNRMFNAMLKDTFSPTLLAAGLRANVIPSEAKATINCRILPDTTAGEFLEELKKATGDPGLEWKILEEPEASPPPSPWDSPLVRAIEAAAKQRWPAAPVLPLLSTGATDSQALRRAGIPSYGLLPFPLLEEDLERMHGNDERLPLASFADGVELIYRSISGALR